MKAKVSERALVARIRRKLAHENQTIRTCRPDSRWFNDFGAYYVVDTQINRVEATHCDLEELARELGVLKAFEALEEDHQTPAHARPRELT